MFEICSMSPEQTRQVGKKLSAVLLAGDTVLLVGDLAAGKTEFVKGIAEGLEVGERVTSPTFSLLHIYQGKLPIYHFDLYRLQRPEELQQIGFEEYGDGVTLVEWPDRFPAEMPEEHIAVELSPGELPEERVLKITSVGSYYRHRLERSGLF